MVDGREIISHTDLTLNGILPIHFSRYYDSASTYDSPLGYGWAHSYDYQLHEYSDGSVVVRSGCGRRDRYLYSGGAYVTPTGARATLEQDGSTGRFTLRYPSGQKALFDVEGRLEAFADAVGNRHEVLYDPRGKLPLTGTSKHSVDPATPMTVALAYRITQIRERAADGTLTGRYIDLGYDETTGRLTQASSSDQRSVEYLHDTHAGTGLTIGNLVQVNGLEGIIHSFVYDDRNAQGQQQDSHNVTSIQLGQGTAPWLNTYDASGRVTRQVRGYGQLDFDWSVPLTTTVTRTIRDQQGQNPITAVEVYEFDPQGYPTRYVDPLKNEWRTTWSTAKQATRQEVWRNSGSIMAPVVSLLRAVDYAYDSAGNLTSKSVTLDSGEVVTETWTRDHDWIASHQIVSSLAPTKVFRTEYAFYRDTSGAPINIHEVKRLRDDGSYQTSVFEYNPNGQLAAITLPAVSPVDGLKLRRTYYAPPEAHSGRLKEESIEVGGVPDPHGKHTFAYDAAGFIASLTDARGHATEFDADELGRLVALTNPLGESTTFAYAGRTLGVAPEEWTPGANLVEIEVGRTTAEGEGQVRRLRWDDESRLRQIERKGNAGSFGPFAAYAYNSEGNRTAETDALGRTTTYTYDTLGRLSSISDAAESPNVTTFAYDPDGRRVQVIDALGRKTINAYDDLGRVLSSEAQGSPGHPLSPPLTTSFEYDAASNMTKLIDPKSQETIYAYSALSQLTAVTQPLGQTVSYAYDTRGRLTRTTNARGQVLVYAYEPWGGLAELRQYPTTADADAGTNLQRTIFHAYDESGNRISTGDTDYSSTSPTLESIAYDSLNRPSDVTVHYVPGGARTLQSAYDRFGNRRSLTFTDGSEVINHTWTYDKLNRLVQANLASPTSLELTYFANDDLESIHHGNGVTTEYTYFPEGPIETITVSSSAAQLSRLTYVIDKVLNITGMEEQHSAAGPTYAYTYVYDAIDRLTSATYPTALGLPASESFVYDGAGNREDPSNPSAYEYDANNRIIVSPGKVWAYDADGNPVSANSGLATEETFTHDPQGRLQAYTSAATSTNAAFLYDPFARRIRASANGDVTWFIWDGDQIFAEFNAAGNRRRRFAYVGGWVPVEQALVDGSIERVQQVHTDHIDTPRLLSDDSGQVVWRGARQAFGRTVVDEDPDLDATTVEFPFRFPGQWEPEQGGPVYNRFRHYDSDLGRYLVQDPLGQAGGANLFAYGRNHPLANVDPYGLFENTVSAYCRMHPATCAAAGLLPLLPFIPPPPGLPSVSCSSSTSGSGSDAPPAPPPPPPPPAPGPTDATPGVPPPPVPPYNPDPTAPPGEGWEWRGPPGSTPGTGPGSWYNPGTGVSIHPDRGHAPPIGPHNDIDIKGNKGPGWRQFPDGSIRPKL